MNQIALTQGQVAIVDDEDFDALNQFGWRAQWDPHTRGFYAVRSVPIGGGKRATVLMHRVITGAAKGTEVDHANQNTLDNRKANLRVCTASENARNRGKTARNTSGYKGVSFDKRTGKWDARIGLNGKRRHLGYFDTALEAAAAYDRAALEMHGTFARHNGTNAQAVA